MTPGRVLLTGATGFIGARVAERLHERGHTLALLVRCPRSADRAAALYSRCEMIVGDLALPETYADAVRAFRPDTLVHAAWSGVSSGDRNEPSQIGNIASTALLLEEAMASGIEAFVGFGSQAEYGPKNRKLDEQAPTEPTTLYGYSKLAACRVAKAMCRMKSVRHAWLRVFSVYGPRDNPGWLIPSLIAKLQEGAVPALTRCEQIWDFLYIDDAADAAVAVVESATAAGVFNLGSGTGQPLREVVTLLRDAVRPGAELGFGQLPYRSDQVMHLEADIARLHDATGWQPTTGLKRGLMQVVKDLSPRDTGKSSAGGFGTIAMAPVQP